MAKKMRITGFAQKQLLLVFAPEEQNVYSTSATRFSAPLGAGCKLGQQNTSRSDGARDAYRSRAINIVLLRSISEESRQPRLFFVRSQHDA